MSQDSNTSPVSREPFVIVNRILERFSTSTPKQLARLDAFFDKCKEQEESPWTKIRRRIVRTPLLPLQLQLEARSRKILVIKPTRWEGKARMKSRRRKQEETSWMVCSASSRKLAHQLKHEDPLMEYSWTQQNPQARSCKEYDKGSKACHISNPGNENEEGKSGKYKIQQHHEWNCL